MSFTAALQYKGADTLLDRQTRSEQRLLGMRANSK